MLGRFIVMVFVLSLVAGAPAHAGGKVAFECPDLHNDRKRSIEPLFQGYDGWFFRQNDLKMDFSMSPQTQEYFQQLDKALSAKGVKLVVLPLLSRAMMASDMVNHDDPWQENYDLELARASYAQMVKDLSDRGIKVIDVAQLLDEYNSGDPYKYNFKRDIHWKPESARLVAGITASQIMTLPGYDAMSPVDTISRKREEVGRAGTVMEELQKLCKGDIQAEPFHPYEAERNLGKDAESLFGDQASAVPVSLIGTSFSAVEEFNFLAFLEESSKREVANFSIAGGGMFTSLISYLSSPFFHENVPPVLIWETQAVYDFNKGVEYGFRQALPAISGPCADENVLAENTLRLSGDGKPYKLLDGLKKFKATGRDYYLHIVADNLALKRFALEMEYDDQDGEWFPVDRSDRYNNRGHFFVELSDKISGNLDSITMKDAGNIQSKLNVRLCRKPVPAVASTQSFKPEEEKTP